MATKNIFDQFDEQPQTAAPAAAQPAPAAPAPSKNVFDQFDEQHSGAPQDDPNVMPQDQYLIMLHSKLKDPKETRQSIMDWSAGAGHTITSPKAVDYYKSGIHAGTMNAHDVPVTFDGHEANVQDPKTSTIGAFLRNAGMGATLDWGDEIGEHVGAAIEPTVRQTGETYDEALARLRAEDQELAHADETQHSTASTLGYGTGMVASALLPVGEAAEGIKGIQILSRGGKLGKVARASAAGATIAATDAAGAADDGHRIEAAEEAAPVGAVAGPLVEPAVRIGGRVVGAIANRTGVTDALDAASAKVNDWARRLGINNPQIWDRVPAEIKALAQRARVNPDQIKQMQQAAETYRNAGVDPRTVDVVTPTQQDAVASVIRKDQGAGRDVAYQAARDESNNLGATVKGQFDRVTNVGSENLDSTVDRIGERRDYRASEVMGQLRNRPLPLNTDVINVLNTQVGRAALREATRAADPATRDAMLKLPDLMAQLHTLGPAARDQILRQSDNPFTVGMADRIRIALNDAAESARRGGKGGLANDIKQLRDTIRGAAGSSDPQYAEYLKNYGEDSRSVDAADLGRTALDRNTDEFVPKAQALGDDPNAVLNASDVAPSQGTYRVTADRANSDGTGRHLRITRQMDDGTQVHFHINAPATREGGTVGELSVDQTSPGGNHISFGNPAGYNTVGPTEMRDAMRYFRENYGGPNGDLSHIEGFTGHRIGGAREAAADRRLNRYASDADAGVTREFDGPGAEFVHRNGYNMDATVDEYARGVDDPQKLAHVTADDILDHMHVDGTHSVDEPGAREFAEELAARLRARSPTTAEESRGVASNTPDGEPRTTNGLTYDEVRNQYQEYLDLHNEHGDGDQPMSFHHWATENFHQHEMPDHFWAQARAEGDGWRSDLMDDESGQKNLPSRQRAIDYINSRRNPPPPAQAPAATGPVGTNGVTNSGVDTRVRNSRPEGLPNSESYHAVKPREVLADSDRQLATGAMSRTIESKSGEGVRGAYEVGRKLAYAPEQQKRNAALLGDSVAAEVQRAMDATMRKAANTARIAPSTGSPTAIRGEDDSVTQLVNAFGHAASGNKLGLVKQVASIFGHAGITPTQSKNLITRVLDPTQTDQVIRELSKYMGRDGAMEVTRHIRQMIAQGIGNTAASNQ